MKAPEVNDFVGAHDLAQCICNVLDRVEPWSQDFVTAVWYGKDGPNEFNRLVAYDWEHVWTESQCRRIMTLHVANRLG